MMCFPCIGLSCEFFSFFLPALDLAPQVWFAHTQRGRRRAVQTPDLFLALCSFLHSSWALVVQESRKEGEAPRGE